MQSCRSLAGQHIHGPACTVHAHICLSSADTWNAFSHQYILTPEQSATIARARGVIPPSQGDEIGKCSLILRLPDAANPSS